MSLAVALLLALGSPTPALAQPSLGVLENRFDSLRARYDQALSLLQTDRYFSQQALVQVTNAQNSGDPERLEQARSAYHALAVTEMAAAANVRAIAEQLRVAAEAMIAAEEDREDELLTLLNNSIPLTDSSQESLRRDLQRVRTRVQEADTILDRIGGGIGENLDLRPVLQIEEDPRDTPDLLRVKAEILEEEAGTYEEIVANTDSIIADLERREREQQTLADLRAELQRFDQDLIPGGRTLRPPAGALAGTNQSGALAEYTLAEQIELFRGIRALATEYRDLALARARDFRVAAGDLPR